MFQLNSEYKPTGDQPQAIEALTEGLSRGLKHQVLLGVTGSGKTFTMANIIKNANRPALIIAHNKTLAAQLAAEFREFFPENAVGYFVSYYDYYQPEAYIPSTDTFIEKDSSVNDEIDRMRHSATAWLSERRDVVIVASVSCIYGLGDPSEYEDLSISLREGMTIDRDELLRRLIDMQYARNDFESERGTFRVRGENIEIIPAASQEKGVRVELFGDEIERISEVDIVTGKALRYMNHVMIFPASHYATSKDKLDRCLENIEQDLETQLKDFRDSGTTILLVEQNANKALDICDRAYVLENGKIVLENLSSENLRNINMSKFVDVINSMNPFDIPLEIFKGNDTTLSVNNVRIIENKICVDGIIVAKRSCDEQTKEEK